MKNFYVKLVMGMVVLLTTFALSTNAQIYSTPGGGPWDSTWTWTSGVVPGLANDVVINGPVYSSSNACNNLVISASGSLQNNFYAYALTVHGNLANNGTIQNYSGSGHMFTLHIHGNIANNGTWTNHYTYLNGSADQHFTSLNDNVFSGYQLYNGNLSGVIYFDNEARFQNTELRFNNHPAEISANSTLYLHDGFLYQTTLTGNGSTSTLYGLGVSNVDAPYIEAISVENLSIDGAVNTRTVTFNGTVINNGILQNDFNTFTLTINDDFINNGTIENYVGSGYILYTNIYGNITNNGTWQNQYMQFYGDANQEITLQAGNNFSPVAFTSNKTDGHLEALTDLEFDQVNIDLINDTLLLQNNSSLSLSGGYLYRGIVLANDAKSGTFELNLTNEAYIQDCVFTNSILTGNLDCRSNSFYGHTINNGIIQNDFNTFQVVFYDLFTNNGTIKNYTGSGYILYVDVYGDIINNGIWNNYDIEMRGDELQTYTQNNDSKISTTYFTITNTDSYIESLSDILFENCSVNLNGDTLLLPSGGLISHDGGYLYNGTVLANDAKSGNVDLFMVNEAYIQDIDLFNPTILGKVDCRSNTFHGDIIVEDTLQNDFYPFTLNIDGNIINKGVIKNYVGSGHVFNVHVSGNITNNGTWSNQNTYLNGSDDQHITCLNDSVFSGYQLTNDNTSGIIYFDNEVKFENTRLWFNNNPAEISANSTLYLHDAFLYQTSLTGNGSTSILHGFGVSNVDAPYLDAVAAENLTIEGAVNVKTVTFNGTVINNGILQNDFYSYTLTINDDFINNGTIENYGNGYNLTSNVYGNIINNGVWESHAINFYGDNIQQLSLQAGNTFSPTGMTSSKPNGYIEALTDLVFDQVNINLNFDTLFLQNNASIDITGGYLYQGVVLANESKSGNFELFMGSEAYLQDCHIHNPTLYGIVDFNNNNNTLHGDIIVEGTLQNDYYAYTLTIDGNITNNGVIKDIGTGYGFTINISGDLKNNGQWTNNITNMNGITDQYILLKNGHWINGQMRFVSDILVSPYLWYRDGLTIDHEIINGETSSTLTWISPVTDGWVGTYNCLAGGTYSRDISIDACNSTMDIAPVALDFGSQEVSPGTDMLSTFITNNGDCELYIEDLYLSGLQAPYSTAINHLENLTILPDQSYEIPVTLNTDYLPGIYNDQLFLSPYNLDDTDINAGLVAYYPFNGNTNDESGNANHGLAKNGAMLDGDRFGNANNAYYFDGVDDYIEILDATSLRPVDISISGWYNFSSVSSAIRALIGKTVGTAWQDSYTMWRHNSMKGATGADGQFDEIAFSHSTVQDTWYHIAYTFNDADDTHSLYINGEMVVTEANTLTIGYDSHPLLLGADIENEVLSYFFHGLIDDVRIYNRTISADEVNELYYENQQNPDIVSITVQAELTFTPEVAITAFFEGPFNGTDMNANLNNILPLQQPYNIYPWEYDGSESVPSIPNADVVDWLLVEFRDAPDAESANSETSLGGQAAFILRDGSIVDLDGSSPLAFDYTLEDELFVLLWHRNHLPVMSANPLTLIGPAYSYDFTTAASQAYADNQSDLGGVYGMIGGDANGDGTVDENDGIEAWYPQVGTAGYLSGDVNMDGEVNNPDKNDIWLPNYGKSEILPGGANSCGSALIDSRDGQSYTTLEIGTQCWMGENLNVGTRINGTSPSSNNSSIEKYCFNDQESNCDADGGFYTWDEVMNWTTGDGNQGICPDGWHVPSHSEWCTMEQFLDPTVACDNVAWRGTDIGTQLKDGGTSGFNALYTGGRYWDGTFKYEDIYTYFWTSSSTGTGVSRTITTTQPGVLRGNNTKTFGFSMRCVKD